jgi:hypothetical protein
MAWTQGPDHLEQMLNRQAKTNVVAKRGIFDVTKNEEKFVVKWSSDQRVEEFLVKEPTTQQESQGAITDVFFRLKQRLSSPTTTTPA